MVLLLALGFVLFSRAGARKWALAVLGFGFAVCTFLSGSRISATGAVLGVGVLLLLNGRAWKFTVVMLLGLVIAGTLRELYVTHSYDVSINERWHAARIEYATAFRQQYLWKPMLEASYDHFWTGVGTGALGLVEGTKNEAHNHYLRVLLESGIIGLGAFLWLLSEIVHWTARIHKGSRLVVSKVFSSVALGATVGLSFGALFEDAFLPVVPNELWWLLVGLAMAARRIERGLEWTKAANQLRVVARRPGRVSRSEYPVIQEPGRA
jgi:O-antigen ligase